jgi:hypothetical protein
VTPREPLLTDDLRTDAELKQVPESNRSCSTSRANASNRGAERRAAHAGGASPYREMMSSRQAVNVRSLATSARSSGVLPAPQGAGAFI